MGASSISCSLFLFYLLALRHMQLQFLKNVSLLLHSRSTLSGADRVQVCVHIVGCQHYLFMAHPYHSCSGTIQMSCLQYCVLCTVFHTQFVSMLDRSPEY